MINHLLPRQVEGVEDWENRQQEQTDINYLGGDGLFHRVQGLSQNIPS